MTDIIANAKQLLDGGMAGPWIVSNRSFGVIDAIGPIERDPTEGLDVDSGSAELAAAAPELAQVLAEETWEYAVQAKRGEEWETCTNSETHVEEWWEDKDDAEWAAIRLQEQGRKTRLVRRRVSPPEVIDA